MPCPPVHHRLAGSALARAVAAAAVLLTGVSPSVAAQPAAADRSTVAARWSADLDSLVAHMTRGYANLEWTLRARGPAFRSSLDSARGRAARASNDGDGRRAVEQLLRSLEDPHVRMGPIASMERTGTPAPDRRVARTLSPSAACSALRYQRRGDGFHRAVRGTPGFREVTSPYFTIGEASITAANGVASTVGFVRLSHTSQHAWPAACERAWPAVVAATEGDCGNACELALWHATGDTLLAALAEAVRGLHARGATTLVLDLTGNGGGSEWASAVATTLSPHVIRDNPLAMVRHPHWSSRMPRRIEVIDSALARPALAAGARVWLTRARAHADSLRQELDRPCPTAAVWATPAPACTPLVVDVPLPVPADSAALWGIDDVLGIRTAYRAVPSWDARLLVLTDERTASAAELIAAVLADRAGAALAGARTMGAGCGFTNGGIPYALPNSRHTVRLPDCARLRTSGENERAGIAPTLGAPWDRRDGDGERTTKFQAALRELVSR